MEKHVTVNILRQSPEEGELWQEYKLPLDEPCTLQQIIRTIQEDLDPGLSYRNYNCYQGICACCIMELDGKPVKSCATLIKPGAEIKVSAAKAKKIIKDLVSDI